MVRSKTGFLCLWGEAGLDGGRDLVGAEVSEAAEADGGTAVEARVEEEEFGGVLIFLGPALEVPVGALGLVKRAALEEAEPGVSVGGF